MSKNSFAVSAINVNINRNQVADLIDLIPNGKIFGIEFELKQPYCSKCGCKSVKLQCFFFCENWLVKALRSNHSGVITAK